MPIPELRKEKEEKRSCVSVSTLIISHLRSCLRFPLNISIVMCVNRYSKAK